MTWLIDLMMGVPHIVLLISDLFTRSAKALGRCLGVAITHWPSLARVVRAEVLQCKEADFVAMARRL